MSRNGINDITRKRAIRYALAEGLQLSMTPANSEVARAIAEHRNEGKFLQSIGSSKYLKKYFLKSAFSTLLTSNKQPPVRVKSASQPKVSFYDSPEWAALRYKALELHGAVCQCCGRDRKNHKVVLHVDHIKPRSLYPELQLELSNLQILCADCNLGKSNRFDTDWR